MKRGAPRWPKALGLHPNGQEARATSQRLARERAQRLQISEQEEYGAGDGPRKAIGAVFYIADGLDAFKSTLFIHVLHLQPHILDI